MNSEKYRWIWIINASSSCVAFINLEKLEHYVRSKSLTGTASLYPLNSSVYDWAVNEGFFRPKRADQRSESFKLSFSSASQPHFHFEGGEIDSGETCREYQIGESSTLFRVQMPKAAFPSAIFDDELLLKSWVESFELKPLVHILEKR